MIEGPSLRWKDGGWHTGEDWSAQINGCQITIPAGFRFDLASIPHLFRSLLDKEDLMVCGPLVHDASYQARGRIEHLTVPPTRFTRRATDRIFRQLMKQEGVSGWKRWVAWAMVRAFGWAPWPPSKSFLRSALVKAFHTAWQTGFGCLIVGWADWHPALVVPIAAALSLVKSLVVVPVAERLGGVVYR